MITKEDILAALNKYYNTNDIETNLDKIRALHNRGKINDVNLNDLFGELAKSSPNLKLLGWALDGVILQLRNKLDSYPPHKADLDHFLIFLKTELYDKKNYAANHNLVQFK